MSTCPRRMQEYGPWEMREDLDSYSARDGKACCSFCGSLHPDVFLNLMVNGCELGPTDKTYKVYVDFEGKSWKFYFQHFTEEAHREKFIMMLNDPNHKFKFGYPGYFYRLPYFLREVNDDE